MEKKFKMCIFKNTPSYLKMKIDNIKGYIKWIHLYVEISHSGDYENAYIGKFKAR